MNFDKQQVNRFVESVNDRAEYDGLFGTDR